MKIYFAGSIRGGRDFKDNFMKIIEHLKQYGQVLTEHIGDKNLTGMGEISKRAEDIYKRDLEWVKEADVIVADVSQPSLGVGYELGISESLGKRILCLYLLQNDKSLSAMVAGNNKLTVENYRNIEEACELIDKYFSEI